MSASVAPASGGVVQTPRLRVKANGIAVPFPIEANATLPNTNEAGSWAAGISFSDADQMNMAWWASQSTLRIEIDIALDANNFQTMIVGNADEIEIAPDHNYVTLTGRDLTALLIDKKTATTYQNQTSSEVATLLANAVGLTPVVTKTTTPIGQFYANDHTRMSMGDLAHSITDWDLLVYLAQQEDFDVFVAGTSLYFQPKAVAQGAPFQVWWSRVNGVATSNVQNLQMKRSATIAHDVSVTVQSWNSYQGKLVQAKASSKANGSSSPGPAQNYVFYRPNMTPSQAADYANQRLADISRHERVISFDIPGEMTLTPRSVLQLSKTGTPFDQLYYPDTITRSIHFKRGYCESVTARNHTVSQQVSLASGGGKSISSLGFGSQSVTAAALGF
ncbi:MAG: hypothetical protein KGI54_16155 [Pseudomonadota bacterium]|nr:hypothetical protein [Pseudomonadota bacterium]